MAPILPTIAPMAAGVLAGHAVQGASFAALDTSAGGAALVQAFGGHHSQPVCWCLSHHDQGHRSRQPAAQLLHAPNHSSNGTHPLQMLLCPADTLVPNLTVEAQLYYAADLSNARGVTAAEKTARVDDAIQLLRLEDVRRRRIGCAWAPGISGERQN